MPGTCQKDGIVSIPIIIADKQNNLWWLFSYYSSNEYKIWTYRLYIYDKLYALIKQYLNYLYSYTEYSTVMTAHFEMLEGQTDIIHQWYKADVWEIHMKEVVKKHTVLIYYKNF